MATERLWVAMNDSGGDSMMSAVMQDQEEDEAVSSKRIEWMMVVDVESCVARSRDSGCCCGCGWCESSSSVGVSKV